MINYLSYRFDIYDHYRRAGGLHRRGRALYCGKCHTPKEAYFPQKQAALVWA